VAEAKFKDAQLNGLLRELRAETKTLPKASRTLERVEGRLVYLLRLLGDWDRTHAARAEELLKLGRTESAAATAALIFSEDVRRALYDRAPLTSDTSAAERYAEAEALGREVV
jgi:hypothetical protein